MILGCMIAIDEDALICDLAETYHIYDYRSLPAKLAATYSVGLRDDSRIKSEMRGDKLGDSNRLLLALIYDAVVRLGIIGDERPASAYDAFYGELPEKEEKTGNALEFSSPDEFEQARNKILRGEM